jgi:hypothetical protein
MSVTTNKEIHICYACLTRIAPSTLGGRVVDRLDISVRPLIERGDGKQDAEKARRLMEVILVEATPVLLEMANPYCDSFEKCILMPKKPCCL